MCSPVDVTVLPDAICKTLVSLIGKERHDCNIVLLYSKIEFFPACTKCASSHGLLLGVQMSLTKTDRPFTPFKNAAADIGFLPAGCNSRICNHEASPHGIIS